MLSGHPQKVILELSKGAKWELGGYRADTFWRQVSHEQFFPLERPQSWSQEGCWVSFYFLGSGFLYQTANYLGGHKEKP